MKNIYFYAHKTLAIKFCAYIIELMEGNNANQPRLGDNRGRSRK